MQVLEAIRPTNLEAVRRRFTREEYHRAAESGVFHPDERLELFEGEVLVMSPQKRPHRKGIRQIVRALEDCLPDTFVVWYQFPLVLSDYSEPEPDVMVLYGPEDRYDDRDAVAEDVALLVEVADASVGIDTQEKASRYAAAGIEDYWVLNIPKQQLEIYRDPAPDKAAIYGFSYRSLRVCNVRDTVAPLEQPTAAIRVSALLSAER
jgi:Uma2 family endonuclease